MTILAPLVLLAVMERVVTWAIYRSPFAYPMHLFCMLVGGTFVGIWLLKS